MSPWEKSGEVNCMILNALVDYMSCATELGTIQNEITCVVSRSVEKQDNMDLQRSNPFPGGTLNHLSN